MPYLSSKKKDTHTLKLKHTLAVKDPSMKISRTTKCSRDRKAKVRILSRKILEHFTDKVTL